MSAASRLRTKPTRAPHIPVERFPLSCGATLLVSPRPGATVVSVQIHLRGGHALDPPGREGTAYLAGGLADQGTNHHSEPELAELLEPCGGRIGGDWSGLSGSIAGEHWKLLLELCAEVLTEPTYPGDRVERQKARVLEKLRTDLDDPRVQSGQLFRKLVYGDHWLGRQPTGTVESLPAIEREHLLAHHRQHWCGARTVIAVCGDVDPAAVRRLLDKHLAKWKRGKPLETTPPVFPKIARRAAAFTSKRHQVHVQLGHLGIRRRDPDYEALAVMDHVLGTGPGFTNRISRRLRDELGLAYTVHAAIHSSAGVLPGTFSAYIGTSPAQVGTAVAGFVEEMRRIRDELVAAEELELARSYILGSIPMSFERAVQRAGYLISVERFGLPPDNLERLLARIEAITAEDVRDAARAHLHPDRPCLATGGPTTRRELDAILKQVASAP